MNKKCADLVNIRDERGESRTPRCAREHGHPVVPLDNGRTRRFEFHRGEGFVWDDRCAWPEGQEPTF